MTILFVNRLSDDAVGSESLVPSEVEPLLGVSPAPLRGCVDLPSRGFAPGLPVPLVLRVGTRTVVTSFR